MGTVLDATVTKEEWGPGPWQGEPDEVLFEHAGLHCAMRRAGEVGSWCGYVRLPERHPWRALGMRDLERSSVVEVHGGVTFAGELAPMHLRGYWVGFDCAHAGDYMPGTQALLRRLMPGRYASYDHAEAQRRAAVHWMAADVYRDLAYVRVETERLAEQARLALDRAQAAQEPVR